MRRLGSGTGITGSATVIRDNYVSHIRKVR